MILPPVQEKAAPMAQTKIGFKDAAIERHPKAPDGMEQFERAAGSIHLGAEAPSRKFIEEWAERWLDQSARD